MTASKRTPTTLFLCFLLSLTSVESGSEAEIIKALEETQKEVAWKYIPLSGPSIDKSFSKNITVQLGKTAVLHCRIKYLGGKTVSWMRTRDLHLLTVGRFTYTSDERFRAVHTTGSDDWLLKIHYAQHRDSGGYECQVSTTPPISASVWLTVVAEPETQVLGGPDLHVNSGSTINLTCVVHHSDDPPPYILWYHQNELLSYDSPRGGITVVTEHGKTSSSRLLIQRATSKDAGQYTCRPGNAEPHHIIVHIIPSEYEHPAAIHHKNGTSGGLRVHHHTPSHSSFILSLILSIIALYPNLVLFISSLRASKNPQKSSIINFKDSDGYLANKNIPNCTNSSSNKVRLVSSISPCDTKTSKIFQSKILENASPIKTLTERGHEIVIKDTKVISRISIESHQIPEYSAHSHTTHSCLRVITHPISFDQSHSFMAQTCTHSHIPSQKLPQTS